MIYNPIAETISGEYQKMEVLIETAERDKATEESDWYRNAII